MHDVCYATETCQLNGHTRTSLHRRLPAAADADSVGKENGNDPGRKVRLKLAAAAAAAAAG